MDLTNKLILFLSVIFVSSFNSYANDEIVAKYQEYPVYVDSQIVDNAHLNLPILSYKNMAYIPLENSLLSKLGVFASESGQELKIYKLAITKPIEYSHDKELNLEDDYLMQEIEMEVFIDNEKIELEYPVLKNEDNMTYIPLESILLDKIGVNSMWSNQLGLKLYTLERDKEERQVKIDDKVKIVNPYMEYGYLHMREDLDNFSLKYPEYFEQGIAGYSVEGRAIPWYKIGSGEKKIFAVGSHHAREYISTTYLMKISDEILYSLKNDTSLYGRDIKQLMSEVSIYVIPMLNPDGVNLVQNGPSAVQDMEAIKNIKMLKSKVNMWKSNINGVDLNRNYPAEWYEKKSNTDVPSSEMYKGPQPASEPETVVAMNFTNQHDFLLACSYHTKGEVIYWSDSGTIENTKYAEEIVDDLVEVMEYLKMPIAENPEDYGAGYENWFRKEFLKPGFVIELTPYTIGDSSPHDDRLFDSIVWDKAAESLLILMESTIKYDMK